MLPDGLGTSASLAERAPRLARLIEMGLAETVDDKPVLTETGLRIIEPR